MVNESSQHKSIHQVASSIAKHHKRYHNRHDFTHHKLRCDLVDECEGNNFNEPVNIVTKEGNAIVISEEDYNGLMETLYLSSIPEVKNAIIEGINTPISECIPESEVDW